MSEIHVTSLRVAIYARVSTEEQRAGQTIDSQIEELKRFVIQKSWQLEGIYKDDGWSGAIMARPELDQLRDDASKARFDAVLINDVDRLARDVTHLGVIKRDLERQGIQVIFRKLPAEKSPTHNLMVNILGSFAEFEREMISDRTRRGRRHKIEVRKQFLGAIPCYGYKYIPKDRSTGKEGSWRLFRRKKP
jgi:site-specific DNA recombinase